MTEELIRGAIRIGLEDAGAEATDEQKTEVILASIRTALRLENRMNGGIVPPAKPVAIQSSATEQSDPPLIIPTPAPSSPDSMIVLPGQPPANYRPQLIKPGDATFAARPTSDKKEPERVPMRLSSLNRPVVRQRDNWKIEKLVAALHEQMPETLDVVPIDKSTSIRLTRNIEAAAPNGAAKVIYTIKGMSPDQPGVQGKMDQSTGEVDGTIVAARIGRYVTKTFYVTDPLDLGIQAAVDTLCQQARDVFRERSRELFSATPRRTGHLRYDIKDPHVDYQMDLSEPERR